MLIGVRYTQCMAYTLSNDLQRMVDSRVGSGRYASSEDVVAAALASLEQDEARSDVSPQSWDDLLADGEQSGPPIDGQTVLARLRALRENAGAKS